MNRFLLKNDTTENVSARVTVSPSDELGNLGHDAATVIEGDRLTTCLAPTAVAFPEPTGHRSQCFELNDNGRYAVEINGVVQPYAFTPADLMDCFNGQHESQVRFLECMRPAISCDGANSQVSVFMSLPWQAESGGAINLYNDETNELISEIQGYYLSPPDYNMADRLSPDVTYITANSEGNSTQTDYGNYRVTQQLISYRNTTDNPVRLRFEILHSSENEFPKTIFTEETEFHHNPTLFLIEETQDYSVYGVCLAPAEPKPSISCDGATNSVMIKSSDGSDRCSIELNGVLYSSAEGNGLSILIQSESALRSVISVSGDGEQILENMSTETPLRIRIIPANDVSWSIYSGDTNPTANLNEDGSISVCLAPFRQEISCEGATTEAYIAFNGWDSAEYDVEINGVTARVVVTTPSDIVSAYLESVPDANLEGLYASGGSSSTHTLYNTNETTDYRIRIMPISSENLTEEELIAKFNGNVWENPPQNPTFGYDTTTGEITFCLAHVVDDGMVDAEASGFQVLWTKTLTAGDEYGLTYSLDDGATQEQVTWTVPEGEMYLSHAYYNLFKQIPLFKSEDTPAGTQYAFTVELSPHSLAFDLNGNSRVYPDSTPVKVTVYPKPHATNAAYDKSLYDDYPDATIGTFISGGLLTS